jgi:hypothetical protein
MRSPHLFVPALIIVASAPVASCANGAGSPPPAVAPPEPSASIAAPAASPAPAPALSPSSSSAAQASASAASPASATSALDPFAVTPSKTFAAWTDGVAIGELAANCAFAPEGPSGAETSALLSCKLSSVQSSAYDPCLRREQKCRDGCAANCQPCDKQCVTTCSACASRCKDDACRRACAKSTGSCKQACLERLDQCTSSTCAPPTTGCETAEASKWKAQGCDAKCPTWNECSEKCAAATSTCTDACPASGAEACKKACADKSAQCVRACDARVTPCDAGYCASGVAPGG